MSVPNKSPLQSHNAFLKYQLQIEKALLDLHQRTSDSIVKIIMRNADEKDLIAKAKITKIVDNYMKSEINDYRKELINQFKFAVSDSSDMGVKAILAAEAPQSKATSFIWQNASEKVRDTILNKRSIEDGLLLSDRVWKLNDDILHQLKKVVASDILNQDSAGKISKDIRKYLINPDTLRGRAKDLLAPGQGVYKSAYKNALRLARTETNKAYTGSQEEVARLMGMKVQVKLSKSHPEEDVCDDYADEVYEPGEGPLPLHPNCMCYYETVAA